MDTKFRVEGKAITQGLALTLSGDLTKQAEEALLHYKPWEQGMGSPKGFLVMDFTQVPYINSAGIAILIRIVRAGVKGNYQTFAYGLTGHYQKLFRMVGLTEYMMIYPDEYAVMQRLEALTQLD